MKNIASYYIKITKLFRFVCFLLQKIFDIRRIKSIKRLLVQRLIQLRSYSIKFSKTQVMSKFWFWFWLIKSGRNTEELTLGYKHFIRKFISVKSRSIGRICNWVSEYQLSVKNILSYLFGGILIEHVDTMGSVIPPLFFSPTYQWCFSFSPFFSD